MAATTPSNGTRRGRVGRGCALAAAVGLVLIGGCGLAAHLYDRHWEKKVEAKLAEYRAAGQPVTWAEVLAARQSIPPEENSALVFLEAFKQLAPPDGQCQERLVYGFSRKWTGGARHPEEVRRLIEAHLDANDAALDKIREAAVLPDGAYPLDPTQDPMSVDMDYLSALMDAVRLCNIEAVYHAEAADPQQATKSLVQGRRTLASIGEGTTPVEGLVRNRGGGLWLDAAQHTLELCQVPADGLRALRAEMAQGEAQLSLELVFRGVRSGGLYRFSGVAAPEVPWSSPEGYVWRLHGLIPGWRHRDALFYCSVLDRAAEINRLPLRERYAEAVRLGTEVQEKTQGSPIKYLFLDFCLRSMEWLFRLQVEAHAALRVGDAALAVERWRLAHGRWPESLDELVPDLLEEVPDDPFCEEKIQYRQTADGVIVYSVGPDGQDDNGTPEEETTDDRYDVRFRLLDPELRGARTLTFREEVMDSGLSLEALEEAGYTEEKLRALGLSEDDIRELGWR